MSAVPTRSSNVTGRSRSPSPGTHPPITMHPPVAHANANLLNPESLNLYKNRRSSNPAESSHRKDSDSAIPLIDVEKPFTPPLANPEIDDASDDRPVVNAPYPGVDDGFFAHEDGTIVLADRAGDMPEGAGHDDADGVKGGGPMPPNGRGNRAFPDLEFGTIPPDLASIPDINLYQHKKTLAQGMMDIALFSANANQLRYVLESDKHPYFYPGVVLIAFSLMLQVAIGVGLIWNSRYNVKDDKEICVANKINNFTVIGIFLVTVVNVFISAFGVASNPVVTVVAAPVAP